MIDYKAIVSALNKEIRGKTNVVGVEQANTDKQPPYPFYTYTVTSPYLNVKRFKMGDSMTEECEVVISYTFSSEDSFQSLNLAQTAATHLKMDAIRMRLRDQGIVVVRIEKVMSRDDFISIQVERKVGFDIRIRVRHTETLETETIETLIFPN